MQRFQVLRVVPVVEMPLIAFQGSHGLEGVLGSFQQLSGRDVAEIIGAQIGQQGQADVGGRGAAGDYCHRVFLHIVERQPVIFGTDIGFEEQPHLA